MDKETRNNNDNDSNLKSAYDNAPPTRKYNAAYSRSIRWLKLILPVIAVSIIAVVLTWENNTQQIQDLKKDTQAPTIGQNELLNPRFESKDKKNQPFTITATRATQGQTDENLVILEKPLADIALSSGNWLAAKSDQGAYRQDTQRLLMTGNVEVFHDQGYTLNTQSLNVDMDQENIWSDVEVRVNGPEGTIQGTAMDLKNKEQILKFFGPAKLTLSAIKSNDSEVLP